MNQLLRHSSVLAAGAILAAILAPVFAKALSPTPAPGFAPDDASVGNSRLLIAAVLQYAQFNNAVLPPTDTVAHFQAAVSPYLANKDAFVSPATHLAYQPNPAIGGHNLTELTPLSSTVAFQDVKTASAAKFTVTFLDSHVEQGGVAAGGGAPAGDPDRVCADRVRAVGLAMLQYVQDNDENYPPIETPAQVQALLLPYAKTTSIFFCPSTGLPYEFNTSLSRATLASIAEPAATVLVQDPVAHANGFRVIGYADGHVNHLGLGSQSPGSGDDANLKQIGLGVLQYSQDNDEFFPTLQSPEALKTAIYPYVRNASVFVNPMTGENYLYNAAYSSWALAQFEDPSSMWLARDRMPNPDGTLYTLYADGHVKSRFTFVARHMSVGPNNEARLIWTRGDGMIALSRVSPTGVEFSRGSLGQGVGTVQSVATSPSGYTSILFAKDETASLWTLNPSFYLTQKTDYGPYDGWVPVSVGAGNNNTPRLLWNRYDGSSAVWQASAANDYLSDKRYALSTGDIATSLAVAPDNSQRLVWTRPSGEVRFWTLSSTGSVLSQSGVAPYYDWKVKFVTVGPNGNTYVLYAGTGGSSLLTLSPMQVRLSRLLFPQEAGWTPQEVGVGADGNARILATNVDGRGRLRIYDNSGATLSSHEFAPY